MPNTLNQLIQTQTEDCPKDLSSRVFAAVQNAALRSYTRQQRLWTVFSAVALITCAVTGWHAASAIASSNFGSYVSLFFSDGAIAFASWKEAGMSLLETLPIAGIGLFLGSIAVTLFIARKAFSAPRQSFLITAHA